MTDLKALIEKSKDTDFLYDTDMPNEYWEEFTTYMATRNVSCDIVEGRVIPKYTSKDVRKFCKLKLKNKL